MKTALDTAPPLAPVKRLGKQIIRPSNYIHQFVDRLLDWNLKANAMLHVEISALPSYRLQVHYSNQMLGPTSHIHTCCTVRV